VAWQITNSGLRWRITTSFDIMLKRKEFAICNVVKMRKPRKEREERTKKAEIADL
jgi:hypothetical protein